MVTDHFKTATSFDMGSNINAIDHMSHLGIIVLASNNNLRHALKCLYYLGAVLEDGLTFAEAFRAVLRWRAQNESVWPGRSSTTTAPPTSNHVEGTFTCFHRLHDYVQWIIDVLAGDWVQYLAGES
jgi:hypothetical protein